MSTPASFEAKFVGQSIKRVEDPLLLTGSARHIDDLVFPNMLHVAFVRSPHPHARIRSIDASAALHLPGVEYVLTGAELGQHAAPGPMAVDKVRYVGEPIAAVAAVSRYVAEDALDLVKVEYEPLPPVTSARQGMEPEAARVHDNQESNVVYKNNFTYGDPKGALARSDIIVRGQLRCPRVSANPIETGGCISRFDPVTGEVTSWSNAQSPQRAQAGLAAGLRVPSNRVRVVVQPHGGSFGSKLAITKYMVVTAVLSKLCGGKPVKYLEDRIEHLMASGSHCWDRRYEIEFGFMRDGRLNAMRIQSLTDLGVAGSPTESLKALTCLTSGYKVKDVEVDVALVVTNKGPDGAYRGMGPPTHFMVIERMMDKAAAVLGLDPAEIRRRNLIQANEFPYTLPSGVQYDSGNYPEVLRLALDRSGYAELRREQEKLRAEGRLVGLSVVFGIEPGGYWGTTGPYRGPRHMGMSMAPEAATIRVDAGGQVQVEIYHGLSGQGHFTFATQLVADYFGVPLESVHVVTAEPQTWPPTTGAMGSRQAVTLSFALIGAADRLREKLTKVAARLLEAPEDDLELHDGAVSVRGTPQRSLPFGQIVATMMSRSDLLPPDVDANPSATYVWTADRPLDAEGSPYMTYASACHVAFVEIDRGTGKVSIHKYVVVDDCGTRLNPRVLEGITQGGLAQGLGCALLEDYVYDEQGQPLAVTFQDYLLPTIYEVPMAEKHALVTKSPHTPLGVKGAGEGAIHVTPAAVFCAINDALAPLGVEVTDAPATPERVWRAIQEAGKAHFEKKPA